MPEHDCGHRCCTERTDPYHDHFLGPAQCPACSALEDEEWLQDGPPMTPRRYVFCCAGKPVTQGSKVAGVNRHTGRAFMRESNKSGLDLWRHAISDEARRAIGDADPLTGPVVVHLCFRLEKPKSAPKRLRTWPIKRGLDVDKGARAALDAMTHILFFDDAQVVSLFVEKDWAEDGAGPGVTATVAEHVEVEQLDLSTAGPGPALGLGEVTESPDPGPAQPAQAAAP